MFLNLIFNKLILCDTICNLLILLPSVFAYCSYIIINVLIILIIKIKNDEFYVGVNSALLKYDL